MDFSQTPKPSPKPYSLNESAIALHEFFSSLVAAGFTPDHAVYLVGQWLGRAQGGTQ